VLDAFLRPRLRKGIPSIFRMLRPFYFQEGKPALVEQLFNTYLTHLAEEPSWFGPRPGETDASPPSRCDEEPPSSMLFSLMVMGEHYDFLGRTTKAMEYVDRAIDHTPTFVEIYMTKARVLKHAGDFVESAKCYDEVRQMDLADRFLNTKSVLAYLHADEVQLSMEKALLFSKEPDSPEPTNLHDMQCMWYESAVGRSYCRQKKYGKALKKFTQTFNHFNDIAEDQFDFHNYCLRKTTLKTYVAMLRMQDRLFSHKFYRRAAKDAIGIYVVLHDQKALGLAAGNADDEGEKEEELSAAEKKKLKHKKKRAEAKVVDEQKKRWRAPPRVVLAESHGRSTTIQMATSFSRRIPWRKRSSCSKRLFCFAGRIVPRIRSLTRCLVERVDGCIAFRHFCVCGRCADETSCTTSSLLPLLIFVSLQSWMMRQFQHLSDRWSCPKSASSWASTVTAWPRRMICGGRRIPYLTPLNSE